jgi:hypothetical protein
LQGYFTHCEYKSDGKYGFLKRRKLVVLTQELVGKESHDILHNDDDPALDDEDFIEQAYCYYENEHGYSAPFGG